MVLYFHVYNWPLKQFITIFRAHVNILNVLEYWNYQNDDISINYAWNSNN